jgi:hypothetical protein
MTGITIALPFALIAVMICRCGQVEEKEARGLAAELIDIVNVWRAWCAANPDRRDTVEEADATFTIIRTVVGCWPGDEKDERVHDESIWLMGCLTDVGGGLYERYLALSDRVLGTDLAATLSADESSRPKPRLQ